MQIDWRVLIVTTLITSVIGAINPILVEIFKKVTKSGKSRKVTKGTKWSQPGLFLGCVIGLALGLSITYLRQIGNDTWTLWSFDKSTESWTYFSDPQDASTNASWDAATKSLRADFDFSQVDLNSIPPGSEPRATFWVGNLDYDWTGYKELIVDVANLNSQLIELSFSFYAGNCFYEFSDGFENIPGESDSKSITFHITEPKFKTCNASETSQNTANFVGIQRFYLIIGTNASKSAWSQVKGTVLIDNIRLQK